jgi:hypothetical protein
LDTSLLLNASSSADFSGVLFQFSVENPKAVNLYSFALAPVGENQ